MMVSGSIRSTMDLFSEKTELFSYYPHFGSVIPLAFLAHCYQLILNVVSPVYGVCTSEKPFRYASVLFRRTPDNMNPS